MGIIYCARHIDSGRIYIGKTGKNLSDRISMHWKNRNDGTYFHKALMKYGVNGFSFSIIDSAPDEVLGEVEKTYIDLFSSSCRSVGYNTTHGGEGVLNNSESLAKMSASKKGKPSSMKGKHFSERAVTNMRASMVGIWKRNKHPRIGATLSPESIAKMVKTKNEKPGFIIKCKRCGAMFEARVSFAMYCSNACKLHAFRHKEV